MSGPTSIVNGTLSRDESGLFGPPRQLLASRSFPPVCDDRTRAHTLFSVVCITLRLSGDFNRALRPERERVLRISRAAGWTRGGSSRCQHRQHIVYAGAQSSRCSFFGRLRVGMTIRGRTSRVLTISRCGLPFFTAASSLHLRSRGSRRVSTPSTPRPHGAAAGPRADSLSTGSVRRAL